MLVHLDQMASLAHLDKEDRLECKDLKEMMDVMVLMDREENLGHQVPEARMAYQVFLAGLDQKALMEYLEMLGQLDHLDKREMVVILGQMVTQDNVVALDLLDPLEHLVQTVKMEQ